jgi:hydroxypyruvate isomerase
MFIRIPLLHRVHKVYNRGFYSINQYAGRTAKTRVKTTLAKTAVESAAANTLLGGKTHRRASFDIASNSTA